MPLALAKCSNDVDERLIQSERSIGSSFLSPVLIISSLRWATSTRRSLPRVCKTLSSTKDEESPTSVGSQSDAGGKQDVIIETGKVNENTKEDESEDKGGFGPYIVSL